VITKPTWGKIADGVRPRIGYVGPCQAIPECGRFVGPGSLRESLSKVADVVDIWAAPEGRAAACDAILAMDCVTFVQEPYFIYLCRDQGDAVPAGPAVYKRAAGLFAENDCLARRFAEREGIPREKIHVIPPAVAANQGSPHSQPPHMREAPRRKLLLCVGGYGGQHVTANSVRLVLEALDILHRKHDPQVRLTIAGLENFPAADSPPDGVTFRGAALAEEKMELFDGHDVLVIPEGIGFHGLPEALSLGVPCVAARTGEMSEAVTPGITGAVVDDGNACEMAAAIASVLANDDIYRRCFERAPAMAAYFSWERVARQVTHVISREVGLMP
jgi:glycosyltransferase involved in cell wall biosynthesis